MYPIQIDKYFKCFLPLSYTSIKLTPFPALREIALTSAKEMENDKFVLDASWLKKRTTKSLC